jgi:glycosyltransferase involved in cell wall biosynthesis
MGSARRIGFMLEQCLAPIPGGTGRYSREIAAALVRTGAGRTVTGWTAAHRDRSAATVPGVIGPKQLPLPRRALIAAWDAGAGPRPRGVDVLHAPTLLVPPRRRTPLVVTIHDAIPWTNPELLTARGAAWHRRVGERVARTADAIVVPSHAVADILGSYLNLEGKLSVIGLGASSDLVVPPDAGRRAESMGLPDRYLISVSTIEPRKGLDVLIKALANPSAPRMPLYLAGQPGWGGVDVDDLARKAGLGSDRVRVLGRLSDADLAVAMSRATALVAPSRDEGFGLPVLEAMTLGTPVVHSDAPALVEVGGGAGLTVPREQPKLLAEALRGLVEDRAALARLRESGLTRAKAFSWDRSAAALWQLYDEVAGGQR